MYQRQVQWFASPQCPSTEACNQHTSRWSTSAVSDYAGEAQSKADERARASQDQARALKRRQQRREECKQPLLTLLWACSQPLPVVIQFWPFSAGTAPGSVQVPLLLHGWTLRRAEHELYRLTTTALRDALEHTAACPAGDELAGRMLLKAGRASSGCSQEACAGKWLASSGRPAAVRYQSGIFSIWSSAIAFTVLHPCPA